MKRITDTDAKLFAGLGDPTRLAIVTRLAAEGPVCACDFGVSSELAQPTISHHLKVLREAGLVRGERRGKWIYYSLDRAAFVRLAVLIAGLRAAPEQSLPAGALVAPTPSRA